REGRMAAVLAGEERVQGYLRGRESEVGLAAVNGPQQVVISGKREAVGAVCGELGRAGVVTRELEVSHAFHSPLMEGMMEAFRKVTGEVRYGKRQKRLISNVTGEEIGENEKWEQYWVEHVR